MSCEKCKDARIKKLEKELQEAISLLRSTYVYSSTALGQRVLIQTKLQEIDNFCNRKRVL